MNNILLIEDSELQIQWAKESLKDLSNLEVAQSTEEGKNILTKSKGNFDIIISDLELPIKQGEKPLIENGISFIKEILYPLRKKGIKIAVISSIEHHLYWAEKHKKNMDDDIIQKNLNRMCYDLEIELKKFADKVITDLSPYVRYYRNEHGETLTSDEVYEKSNQSKLMWFDFVVLGKYKPLKPFKKTVEMLV